MQPASRSARQIARLLGQRSEQLVIPRSAIYYRSRRHAIPIIHSIAQHRLYASLNTSPAGGKKGLRVSHVFGTLAVLGLFVTTYGLLEWYFAFSTWPPEVREDLKKAIRARNRGDHAVSEAAFRSAISTATTLPLPSLGPDPLLKISGLYITLSALQEFLGQTRKAFRTLEEALNLLERDRNRLPRPGAGVPYAWTEKDEGRVVAISQKMGSLAIAVSESGGRADSLQAVRARARDGAGRGPGDKELKEWEDLGERYLLKALEGMMKIGTKHLSGSALASGSGNEQKLVGKDFVFPDEQTVADDRNKGDREVSGEQSIGKVTRKSMGLVMESLADLYVKRERPDLANPLYVQAISALLPHSEGKNQSRVPAADRCQACMLMNTLSSSLLSPPTTENVNASKIWSSRSLELSEKVLNEAGSGKGICEQARVIAEFNLGVLAEMQSDLATAIKHFTRSQTHARDLGFKEGLSEATAALQRLRKMGGLP